MSLTSGQLERFVRRLAATPALWREHVRPSDDERVYALIWDAADVNAWVICWSEDQDTGYHDHDLSAAAIAVIDGHVLEERLTLHGGEHSAVHGPGALITLPPTAIHRVLHAGEGPAVSIHAYSPPLTRTGAYRVTDDGRLEREALGTDAELRAQTAGV